MPAPFEARRGDAAKGTVARIDPIIARKTWRTLEPIHVMIYFVPEAVEHYRLAGIADRQAGYFASRSAPLGEASAELLTANVYNYNPESVRGAAIPMVWQEIRPEELIDARFMAADRALRRLLGEAVASDEMIAASRLARSAARGCVIVSKVVHCSPATPAWRGRTNRISCCGTPRPCCASSVVTVTSQRSSPTTSRASRH